MMGGFFSIRERTALDVLNTILNYTVVSVTVK